MLEFDPKTNSYPWSYQDENSTAFAATARGAKQRLPNGNTLIVDPDNGRILEVTIDKQLVWKFGTPRDAHPDQDDVRVVVTCARRYAPEKLPFLKSKSRRD